MLLAGTALAQAALAQKQPGLAALVNPLVGTDRSGNTFPHAVAPFGMMQLGPNWGGLGYFYTDTHMHGFVVNMMSGAGIGGEGDVLMTATTGPVKVERADTDFAVDHQQESASAGYYQVKMQLAVGLLSGRPRHALL